MNAVFYKYHGAGNDFIIFDNRDQKLQLNTTQIAALCHRRTGIGADGLMLVQNCDKADFELIYYNADGARASFCGNGSRCIADFAFRKLKIAGTKMSFLAADGIHAATIKEDNIVALQMNAVQDIAWNADHQILNTGSPHYIKWVNDLKHYPVFSEGRSIRNQDRFQPDGINVNFAEKAGDVVHLRTYERGVEDETLACGTGVTAVAIASVGANTGRFSVTLKTQNGDLFRVDFEKETAHTAKDVVLTGPVCFVFEGIINI